MPEFGDIAIGKRGGMDVWRKCKECSRGFWTPANKDYGTCFLCWYKPGAEYEVQSGASKGTVYVKLAEDDPQYDMTCKFGFLGAGWVRRGRLVIARQLRRSLTEGEVVRRRDKNQANDDVKNLYLQRRGAGFRWWMKKDRKSF